jgi:single-strand DNA-binding protein
VILAGNLTRDPEMRTAAGGKTSFVLTGLAVNDRVKRGDEWVDEPTFVDLTMFGRTAEVANEFLRKGSPVLIEGRLKLSRWETESGEKRSKLKVICDRMQMLGRKDDNAETDDAGSKPGAGDEADSVAVTDAEPVSAADGNGKEEVPF